MTDIEKARAEVLRLEQLEQPAIITNADWRDAGDARARLNRDIDQLKRALGFEYDAGAGNGFGLCALQTIKTLSDRLATIENVLRLERDPAAGNGAGMMVPKTILNLSDRIAEFEAEADVEALRGITSSVVTTRTSATTIPGVTDQGFPGTVVETW